MLDFADLIAINKFEHKGAEDALRSVRKQYRRNRSLFDRPAEELPVYGTIASQFNDPGTNVFYLALLDAINAKKGTAWHSSLQIAERESLKRYIIPPDRVHYLGEIVHSVRDYRKQVGQQAAIARRLFQFGRRQRGALRARKPSRNWTARSPSTKANSRMSRRRFSASGPNGRHPTAATSLSPRSATRRSAAICLPPPSPAPASPRSVCRTSPTGARSCAGTCSKTFRAVSPSPPGCFPSSGLKRIPKRQFAGEGTPERTNRRFHYLSKDDDAKRLSTAFDSVTLYGEDPDYPPDVYGKVGESGVSICTVDDMKKLFAGFDLCAPNNSVSLTINGPAPMMLAFFINAAIDQQVDGFREQNGREPSETEYEEIRAYTLQTVRGTVQADILKEDQGQNTCIFSTEFALKMMGDIQQYFIDHNVRNYYSVSISGYHIAEAGANPDLATGLHAGQRFHLRRVLPFARHGRRRFRRQPLLLLLQRPGSRVRGHRPRGPAHLGRGHAREVRRQRAQPETQVPYSDLGPLAARPGDEFQRYPHHAAGADGHLRQLQLAAHQRLRRGGHHARPRSRCGGPWRSR